MIEPNMKVLAEKYCSNKMICRRCYARLNNGLLFVESAILLI